MQFYRGVDGMPPTDPRLSNGWINYPPVNAPTGNLYDWFLAQVKAVGNVNSLGFKWRASTPGGLIATAATEEGSFSHKEYVYRMEYPDAELFAFVLNPDGSVAPNAQPVGPTGISLPAESRYLLLSDVPFVASSSTVLALYHGKVNSKECTFLSPIPRTKFTGYRQKHETAGAFKAMP